MSTWHQRQSRARLYHATKWTVVEDPPNNTTCLTLCDTQAQAEAHRDQMKTLYPNWSVYVLKPEYDDADILSIVAIHIPDKRMTFERTRQDRRTYYRLLVNGKGTGSLTDATHARQTIAYWREQGWIS